MKDTNLLCDDLFIDVILSYNMVNGYVQNRQQPRLEVLSEIATILEVDIKELIVSNKD